MELLQVKNNQVVVSSKQVAENFKKRHDHIMRDINSLIEGLPKIGDTQKMFFESTYTNEQNKQSYKEYLMNRDGFCLLVMGFTGMQALTWKLRYINAFNEMEAKLNEAAAAKEAAITKPDSYMIADPVARAQRWIEEESERQALEECCSRQEQLINEMKPKADYVDTILDSKSLVTITAIAKDYGMSGRAMNFLLHQMGIIYKVGQQWLLYSKYQKCGYTSSETVQIKTAEGNKVLLNTKWTQKGRLFLYEKLKAKDIIPMIEQG